MNKPVLKVAHHTQFKGLEAVDVKCMGSERVNSYWGERMEGVDLIKDLSPEVHCHIRQMMMGDPDGLRYEKGNWFYGSSDSFRGSQPLSFVQVIEIVASDYGFQRGKAYATSTED